MLNFWSNKERQQGVFIARVSDLLALATDPKTLARKFVALDKEVWEKITDETFMRTEEMVETHFNTCPKLIYCAFNNGKLMATSGSIYTTSEDISKNKSWLEKTGNGFLTTHNPKGDIMFGVDLSVLKGSPPKLSDKIVLANLIIAVMGEGLKALYLGSRIPSYHKYSNMQIEDYVFGKRKNGKPLDPELYFYLKDGFEIVEIIPEYMRDPESLNYGVLIKWNNPLYKVTKTFPFLKPVIRWVGKRFFLQLPKDSKALMQDA